MTSQANTPGKRDRDVALVDGKAQIQQLQLTVITIEQISSSSAVLAGSSHVLAQAVEGGAFVGISLGLVAVRGADVLLERCYPINLVGRLERTRQHRCLHHLVRVQRGYQVRGIRLRWL